MRAVGKYKKKARGKASIGKHVFYSTVAFSRNASNRKQTCVSVFRPQTTAWIPPCNWVFIAHCLNERIRIVIACMLPFIPRLDKIGKVVGIKAPRRATHEGVVSTSGRRPLHRLTCRARHRRGYRCDNGCNNGRGCLRRRDRRTRFWWWARRDNG